VLERGALNLIFDLAIPQGAFKGDELPLLEGLGELREIPPGIDAVPFGAGFVFAFVVLPAFLGCDVEDDVLLVVLSGLASAFCPRRPMRVILLNMLFGSVSFGLSAGCGTRLPNGCAVATHSRGDWTEAAEGTPACLGEGVRTSVRRVADFGKESVRPKGGGALSAAR